MRYYVRAKSIDLSQPSSGISSTLIDTMTCKLKRPLFCQSNHKRQTDENYQQVVICRGCGFTQEDASQFLEFLTEECKFQHNVRWIGLVITEAGEGGPGGRQDAVFVLHNDDVMLLAPRLDLGQGLSMSWLEDAYDNGGLKIYPKWFIQKYPKTWA